MKFKNTILLIIMFSSIALTIGCSKTVPKTPLEFQKEFIKKLEKQINFIF